MPRTDINPPVCRQGAQDLRAAQTRHQQKIRALKGAIQSLIGGAGGYSTQVGSDTLGQVYEEFNTAAQQELQTLGAMAEFIEKALKDYGDKDTGASNRFRQAGRR